MLTVPRSPLASPAIRTVVSGSSHPPFPFHQAGPSALVSRAPPSPQINLPASPSLSSPNHSGSPASGYFNLRVPSPSPSHLGIASSPPSLAPPRIAVPTPPVTASCRGVMNSISSKKFESLTPAKAARDSIMFQHPSARRRPLFTLDFSRPGIVRDDSFEAVALAGVNFTPGTPSELEWCDSFDSMVTLKPSSGRVATPYPKSDKGWLDGEETFKGHIQT